MTTLTRPSVSPFPTVRLIDWAPVLAGLLALAVVVALPGCGGSAVARPADPDTARKALRDALDAWQGGAAHGSTAVRVADEDWLAGTRLVSYRADSTDTPLGAHLRCPVVLTLKDTRGKTLTRKAVYDVSTDPAPSVVRLDAP